MKEGTEHLSGLEQAILRNIEACKQLGDLTRTSLGPNGTSRRSHARFAHASAVDATIVTPSRVCTSLLPFLFTTRVPCNCAPGVALARALHV
jgi:hypothetical protein